LIFFDYSKHAPYYRYGVVGPDNKLNHHIPIDLPGARPHVIPEMVRACTSHFTHAGNSRPDGMDEVA
jgi:hypothetical protein